MIKTFQNAVNQAVAFSKDPVTNAVFSLDYVYTTMGPMICFLGELKSGTNKVEIYLEQPVSNTGSAVCTDHGSVIQG
jgi:hypothetical protein